MKFKILFLIATLLVGGCTLTDSSLQLKYNIPDQSIKIDSIPEISIKNFVDARKVDDPKFLYYKNFDYGQTTGRLFIKDISVVDFVTDLVRKTAQNAGIKIVDNSDFVLSGKILSLESFARSGLMTLEIQSTLHGEIQINKGTQLISKELIIEKGSSTPGFIIGNMSYEESLEKLFNSLSESVLNFLKSIPLQR